MSSDRTHIIRTDAVVLRSTEYGETSRIVNLLTRERGRLGVMARGARGPKSRFGATLEPMSWIQTVIHYRPGRDLQTLTETSHMEVFGRLGKSLERIGVGVRMIELTSSLLQDGERNPPVLDTLTESLHHLDRADDRLGNIWPFFAMRFALLLGLTPSFERQAIASLPAGGGWLALDSGAVGPDRPLGSPAMPASRAALRAFAICTRATPEVVLAMETEPQVLAEMTHLVESFLHYQVDDAFPDRSARVLGQIGA